MTRNPSRRLPVLLVWLPGRPRAVLGATLARPGSGAQGAARVGPAGATRSKGRLHHKSVLHQKGVPRKRDPTAYPSARRRTSVLWMRFHGISVHVTAVRQCVLVRLVKGWWWVWPDPPTTDALTSAPGRIRTCDARFRKPIWAVLLTCSDRNTIRRTAVHTVSGLCTKVHRSQPHRDLV